MKTAHEVSGLKHILAHMVTVKARVRKVAWPLMKFPEEKKVRLKKLGFEWKTRNKKEKASLVVLTFTGYIYGRIDICKRGRST